MHDTAIAEIRPMSQLEAEAVATWHYEAPYDFYDFTADADDLEELLDPARRGDRYCVALDTTGAVIGFYSFAAAKGEVTIGLGLRPDLTGHGLGHSFIDSGLAFAQETFGVKRFRLSVAAFNERARRVYERAGFAIERFFLHETNGGMWEFVEMTRRDDPTDDVP